MAAASLWLHPPPPPHKPFMSTNHYYYSSPSSSSPAASLLRGRKHGAPSSRGNIQTSPFGAAVSSSSPVVTKEEEEVPEAEVAAPPLPPPAAAAPLGYKDDPNFRGCKGCGRDEKERGCNGEGRIQGGIAAVPLFGWWPIKAYRPCPGFVASGGRYRRYGQSMDDVAAGRGRKVPSKNKSEK